MTTNETGDLHSAGVEQVLDVGCGVASFAAYLLPLGIKTMSFAPKDGHENQIQFALERGIGAMISAIATKQMPYPSSSFDMVHCSRCRVDWHENGMSLVMFFLFFFSFLNYPVSGDRSQPTNLCKSFGGQRESNCRFTFFDNALLGFVFMICALILQMVS